MKKVASQLKLDLAQYQVLAAFAQFAQDLDATTKKRIDKGARLMELLKQSQFEVLPMEQQVCVLFAGNAGYIDSVPLEKVREFESKLLEYVQAHNPEILESIKKTRDFPEDVQNTLKQALDEFKETA